MTKHPFIVLEGIDGTGKTTATYKLAKILSGVAYKTPAESVSMARKAYDSCCSIDARFAYYLSTVILASAEIERLIERTPVVCDRYLYSTIAYHLAMGYQATWIDFEHLPILKPDAVICLIASEDVVRERLMQRDGEEPLHHRAANSVFMNKVADELVTLSTHVVDTTNLSVDQVSLELHKIALSI